MTLQYNVKACLHLQVKAVSFLFQYLETEAIPISFLKPEVHSLAQYSVGIF